MTTRTINRCTHDEKGQRTICKLMTATIFSCGGPVAYNGKQFLLMDIVSQGKYAEISYCPFCGASLVVPSVPEVPSVPSTP